MDTGPRNCGIDSFIMFDGLFFFLGNPLRLISYETYISFHFLIDYIFLYCFVYYAATIHLLNYLVIFVLRSIIMKHFPS